MTRRPSFALVGLLALLGFLLVTTATSARADRQATAPRQQELVSLVEARRTQVDELDRAVDDLRHQVARAEQRATRANRLDRDLADLTARLAAQAGTVPLEGRGLVVRMADSTREPTSPQNANAYRIHDADIQLMVNALFAAGAEAVAVNDYRLVAISAIRSAGDTIMVNFRPLRPPYVIVAIGADRARFNDAEIARRFRRWTSLFGLGFTVDQVGQARVPAYSGRTAIQLATPIDEAGQ